MGPRHDATAAVADELERLGVAKLTILVAGGLLRRTAPREIGLLVPPDFRRRFRGRVIVHDAEADDLVEVGRVGAVPLRVNPALTETDLVLTVTAAETVLHGGPATLQKAIELREPVDALVVGVPPTTPFIPRERPNPVSAAYLGLGLALRLWRNTPPVAPGGTAIIVHPFPRRFDRPTQTPYRALYVDPRTAGDSGAMRDAEATAAQDRRAIDAYRAGQACH